MPSLKEKNRYLLIKGDKGEFFRIMKESLGVFNYSLASFKILDESENYFLVKVNVKALDLVRASLCLYNHNLKIVKVYGTLLKYKKEKASLSKN